VRKSRVRSQECSTTKVWKATRVSLSGQYSRLKVGPLQGMSVGHTGSVGGDREGGGRDVGVRVRNNDEEDTTKDNRLSHL